MADLPRLGELRFGSPSVGDRTPEHLAACAALKRLTLACTKITRPYVAKLKSLEALNLRFTQVSDGGLKHLEGLANLRELNLEGTLVTDAGVAKLTAKLPQCHVVTR